MTGLLFLFFSTHSPFRLLTSKNEDAYLILESWLQQWYAFIKGNSTIPAGPIDNKVSFHHYTDGCVNIASDPPPPPPSLTYVRVSLWFKRTGPSLRMP